MKLSIDFWEVISLMLSFVGLMFAAGKLLLAQIEKRLNERFESLEKCPQGIRNKLVETGKRISRISCRASAALCPQRRLSSWASSIRSEAGCLI